MKFKLFLLLFFYFLLNVSSEKESIDISNSDAKLEKTAWVLKDETINGAAQLISYPKKKIFIFSANVPLTKNFKIIEDKNVILGAWSIVKDKNNIRKLQINSNDKKNTFNSIRFFTGPVQSLQLVLNIEYTQNGKTINSSFQRLAPFFGNWLIKERTLDGKKIQLTSDIITMIDIYTIKEKYRNLADNTAIQKTSDYTYYSMNYDQFFGFNESIKFTLYNELAVEIATITVNDNITKYYDFQNLQKVTFEYTSSVGTFKETLERVPNENKNKDYLFLDNTSPY